MSIDTTLKQEMNAAIDSFQSLPFECYTDPEQFFREQQSVIQSSWMPMCPTADLAKPGDYLSRNVGGEPVMIIRGTDGNVRALSNICRHRGTPILEAGTGNAKHLVCPYHAWTYDLEGNLKAVPYPGDREIEKNDHGLDSFQLEEWGNIVWVNLDPDAKPLKDRLKGIERYLEYVDLPRFTSSSGMSEPATWHSNWKLIIENAMESYHLFKCHKETLEPLAPTKDAFYLEGCAAWSVTAGKYTYKGKKLKTDPASMRDFERNNYILVSIPPGFVGTISQDRWGWLSFEPISPTESLVFGASSAPGGRSISGERDELTEAFLAEDKFLCERAQRGMTARRSKGGKFVSLERVINDFHQYVNHQMYGAVPKPLWAAPEADEYFPKGNTAQHVG
jgi:phenylpropionate dioxygenase-like ring-hydroxylating dioxygenase large terminal subunit